MKIQSVRNLNKETWRKFVAYCKLKDVNVGNELSKVIEGYLKNKFRGLLK